MKPLRTVRPVTSASQHIETSVGGAQPARPVRPIVRTVAPVKPIRAVPVQPRHIEDDEEDEPEQPTPVKTASQRFLEEHDVDEDHDELEILAIDEEPEPKPVSAEDRRKAFATPCDEPDERDDEEEVPLTEAVPVTESSEDEEEVPLTEAVPVTESSEDEEEDRDSSTTRTTSRAEFTEVIGKNVVVAPKFTPSSGTVTPAQPSAVASVTAVVVSGNERKSDAQVRAKAFQLMHEGLTDASVALRMNMPIDVVLDVRRDFLKLSKANNPREMFTRKIEDLDDMFDVAKSNFYDNPQSEINFRAVTEFNKSLRETIEAFQGLEDPAARATEVINRVIKPLLMAQLNASVAVLGNYKSDVVKFVPDHVKRVLEAGIASHARGMSSTASTLYNKAVATLESIYGTDLSQQRLHTNMKDDNSEGTQDG